MAIAGPDDTETADTENGRPVAKPLAIGPLDDEGLGAAVWAVPAALVSTVMFCAATDCLGDGDNPSAPPISH